MANYSGKQQNNTSYIKSFVYNKAVNLWKSFSYNGITVLTPISSDNSNLYIPGNLYVDGSIINPSDIILKENIETIDSDKTNKLMNLRASQYTLKNDMYKKTHYGFIAQEFETEYPELVTLKPDETCNIKALNYMEIIPLLVSKMQLMQQEIDELKLKGGV